MGRSIIICSRCHEQKERASGDLCDTCLKATLAEEKREAAWEKLRDRENEGATKFLKPSKVRKKERQVSALVNHIGEELLEFGLSDDDMLIHREIMVKYLPSRARETMRYHWAVIVAMKKEEELNRDEPQQQEHEEKELSDSEELS